MEIENMTIKIAHDSASFHTIWSMYL